MSAQLGSACSAPAVQRAAAPVARQAGWIAVLGHCLRMMRTRQHLAELDAHLLRDIGLSRPEAEAELRRAPWDAARRP
ncbi:DUF1127 domain-containing protein [Roseomonas sp. USHLN139]|uniref:DUF1127 domain-containing protein n=1 Tax=Roseomonas sp. USHLN139 TaxID=3081298 RepID=UPI003B02CE39